MIKANNLSKRYRIGATELPYKTVREAIMEGVTTPIRNLSKLRSLTKFKDDNEVDVIWALKDISFEMNEGEVLGIIGRNGAGKTTLLKVLSRITEPTGGIVEIHGKVSSLLEVGTGFHPELTGRENVFLNGAILGMRKSEIGKKFDDIVGFAEIEKFIDTPIKRYSSGMQVRLAFAVAAHLEPEIIMVDEVLAVGDYEFQRKCLGKMEDVAKKGRTVIFVSHNMAMIKRICSRTILLEQGKIADDGPTDKVVKHYLSSDSLSPAERKWEDIKNAPGDEVVRLHAIRAKNEVGKVKAEFNIQEPIYVEIEFLVLQEGWTMDNAFQFNDEAGQLIFLSRNNLDPTWIDRKRPVGFYRSVCYIPGNFLNEGTITIGVAGVTTNPMVTHANTYDAISFHVFDPGSGGVRGNYTLEWAGGVIRPLLEWKTEYTPFDDNNFLNSLK